MSTSHAEHHDRETTAGPPRVVEVSSGIYAYIQPDRELAPEQHRVFRRTQGRRLGGHDLDRAPYARISRRDCASQPAARAYAYQHPPSRRPYAWQLLVAEATIIGHPLCREEILHSAFPPPPGIWSNVDWGSLEPEPPFVTFDDQLTVWVDDLRVAPRRPNTGPHHE